MAPGIRVDDLPRMIGPDIISAELIPTGLTRRVASAGVLQGTSHETEMPDIVLLAHTKPDNIDTLIGTVEFAANRGAIGVVTGPLAASDLLQLRVHAQRLGIAVFQRIAQMPWSALDDLLWDLFRNAQAEDFVESSAEGIDDLTSLSDALAEMLGGPVIVEDAKFRLLSYSSFTNHIDRGRDLAILGRRIPDEWLQHLESIGALDTLLNTDDVVEVDKGPFQAKRRLLCAIRAERFLLGFLWVAEGGAQLPADVRERMAVASRVAAPHLLRHQEESYELRSGQRRILRRLLESGKISRSAAEDLGIFPAETYTLMALRCVDEVALSNMDHNRATQSVSMYCQSYRWSAATCTLGNTIYCLVAHKKDLQHERLADLGSSLSDITQKSLLGRNLNVAVSDRTELLNEIPSLREQADRILEVSLVWPSTGNEVTRYEQAYPRIVLSQVIAKMKLDGVVYPKLEVLRHEDVSRGSDYIETLRVYLSKFGDVVAAAAKLQLHVTSLRYRLKRIAEISRLDLSDPSERLLCELLLAVKSPSR